MTDFNTLPVTEQFSYCNDYLVGFFFQDSVSFFNWALAGGFAFILVITAIAFIVRLFKYRKMNKSYNEKSAPASEKAMEKKSEGFTARAFENAEEDKKTNNPPKSEEGEKKAGSPTENAEEEKKASNSPESAEEKKKASNSSENTRGEKKASNPPDSFWVFMDPMLVRSAFALATLIVLFAIGRFLYPVLTSQQDYSKDHILTITQNTLNLVAVVLTLATIGGAIFGYMLRRNVESEIGKLDKRIELNIAELRGDMEVSTLKTNNELDLKINNINNEISNIKEETERVQADSKKNLGTSFSNIILTANMALLTLPEITFTQQIPLQVLNDLKELEKTFGGDSGPALLEQLRENGARIRYALGLYSLGRHANEPEKLRLADLSNNKEMDSVIGRLEAAYAKTDSDYLRRNILIRSCQAYRQLSDYDKARDQLKQLASLDRNGHGDPQAHVLSRWGNALVDLQEGLALLAVGRNAGENLKRRQELFQSAAETMMDVFEDVFGWESDKAEKKPRSRHYISRWNSNIAYYTAKAMWAYRCSFGKDTFDYYDTEMFLNRLDEALDVALSLFDNERNKYIPDLYIAAIYNYCVAFVITVRMSLPDLITKTPFKSGHRKLRFWQEFRIADLKEREDEFWQDYRDQCLTTADELRIVIRNNKSSSDIIYVEGVERLASLGDFREDIAFLRQVKNNPEVLFNFYRTGKF